MDTLPEENSQPTNPSENDPHPTQSMNAVYSRLAAPLAAGALASGCVKSQSYIIMPDEPLPCAAGDTDCGPVATEFQTIVDKEVRTRFTRQDESRFVDWMQIAFASSNLNRINSDKAIISLLLQNSLYRLGFPINVLEHCLQTATRAVKANASDELVLAALLHDIGIAISYHGHAQISAAIIRAAVSDNVYRTVMHHHEFELAHYGHLIGEATDMRALYQVEDWYQMAADFVDNWVQVSYDPNYQRFPLDEFIPLIEQRFSSFRPSDLERTMADCFVETTP